MYQADLGHHEIPEEEGERGKSQQWRTVKGTVSMCSYGFSIFATHTLDSRTPWGSLWSRDSFRSWSTDWSNISLRKRRMERRWRGRRWRGRRWRGRRWRGRRWRGGDGGKM